MSVDLDRLAAAVEAELIARGAKRHGDELRFHCLSADHEDAHASADYNVVKRAHKCQGCGTSGGLIVGDYPIAGLLGLDPGDYRGNGARPYDKKDTKRAYGAKNTSTTSWEIIDPDNDQVVAVHHRHDLPGGGKKVLWSRNGKPGLNGLKVAELPLYAADRLEEREPGDDVPVFLVEGEKAADALLELGVPVVGSVTGASSIPVDKALSVLAGRNVVLWPDNDNPGRKHMRRIGQRLTSMVSSVRIFEPAGLPEKGDAVEWLDSHEGVCELLETIEAIEEEAVVETEIIEAPVVVVENSFNLTDSGNAEYITARHGLELRFDHRRGRWLLWQQHRWQPDADAEIHRIAKASMRQRLRDAAEIEDHKAREATTRWALGSESRARLDSALYLSRAELPIADSGENWDADPMLLCTPSGIVDLRSGELRDGRPEDRITMSTAVPFDPQAICPRWERFLIEVFNGDTELVDFIHRAIGYSLTGNTGEQCLLICFGTGSNGKTTLLNTIKHILGAYGYNMPFSTIEMYQRTNIPNDVAALVGRRFVVASETADGARINESRIKALTGCDPMTARFLHQEFFTFEPVGKFWLAVNHKPVVRDDSHGFWRRIRLISFTRRFDVNPDLADELNAEAPGILAWAVRGCLAWQQEGLEAPAVVTEATAEYERDSDPLAGFLEEACVRFPDVQARASVLYEHYVDWADHHKLTLKERLSSTMFGRKMTERFEKSKDIAGCMVYHGVGCRKAP